MGARECFYLVGGLGQCVVSHACCGHFVSLLGDRQFLVENKYSLQLLFCPSLFFLYLDNYFSSI